MFRRRSLLLLLPLLDRSARRRPSRRRLPLLWTPRSRRAPSPRRRRGGARWPRTARASDRIGFGLRPVGVLAPSGRRRVDL